MRLPRLALPLLTLLATAALLRAQAPVAPRAGDYALETSADLAYSGRADLAQGSLALGDLAVTNLRLSAVRTLPRDQHSAWIVGGSLTRFDVSFAGRGPVPSSLTALNLKLGYNHQFNPGLLLRTELDPGLYSDFKDLNAGDFNAPLGLRLIVASSRELQWLLGVNVDLRGRRPVMGGPGLRWQFAPDWTLLLIVPAPRIEYAVSKDLTVFAGASLRGGTFRVAQDFGRRHGRADLDDQDVSYRELSAGAGLRWNLSPGVALNAGAGWMFDRRFEFDRRNLLLNGDGAPLLQLALTGRF